MPPTGIKKQKTFSYRRHISKPRAYLGTEEEKRQSSLTQLDFVSSTPQATEVIPISSDYEGDEFEVEQPRKKRRVSAKGSEGDDWTPKSRGTRSAGKGNSVQSKKSDTLERGQQTMTQLEFVSSGQQKLVDDIEDDDDDDLDYKEPHLGRRESPASLYKPVTKGTPLWSHESDDEREHVPQSPVKSPGCKRPYKAAYEGTDLALHSIAAHDFTTPKKVVRHSEIPSSQSPPSIKMSTRQSRKSQRHFLGERSPSKSPSTSPSKLKGLRRTPLTEKSVNAIPPRWQPETQESQNPTMKMLQQVRMRTRLGGAPLHEEAPMPPPKSRPQRHAVAESSRVDDPSASKQPPPRKLQRTTTVQDSQASEENIMTQMPPVGLTRVGTVRDSQHEELDLSSQLYRSMSSRENLRVLDTQVDNEAYDENEDEDDNEPEEEEEEYPHTYDPVSAALERDAARYAWTQTQAPRTQHKRTQVVDSEDDSDDDDLDRGIVPDSESEDEIILLPSPTGRDGPSQEFCSEDLVAPNSEPEERTPRPRAIAQKQSSPSPPSSPPPLRPSQVSTVMPTQSSPRFAMPTETAGAEEYSPPTSPPTGTKPSLIKKPQFQDTQALTISSSPLPLPPWSSSGEADLGFNTMSKGERPDNGGNELASLVDFSLPPPPPLGMSSSPWR
ncbi:hypothetical protein MBLNU13_g01015t1 [Cladosporium sp. NU13]